MKKSIICVLSCLVLFIGGVVNKVFAEQGCINTSATSQMEIVPNVIDFDIEIITTSKNTMEEAVAKNNEISSKVSENLKKYLSKENGESLKTSKYSAAPVYKYNNNKKMLDYYQIRNCVKVHTKNVDNVGKMIDGAISDGATSVCNISYSVSCYDNECNKLMDETTKKVKAQAEQIAKSLGTSILSIKSIDSSYSISSQSVSPRGIMCGVRASNSDSCGTNIELGTMKLITRVNASFYVK